MDIKRFIFIHKIIYYVIYIMTDSVRRYKLHKSTFDITTIILIIIAFMIFGYIFFYKKPEHFINQNENENKDKQ
jgi:hypothetical protein